MKVTSIEDKFSAEIDGYINGIKTVNKSKSQEYNEVLDFGRALADTDFSSKSNEEQVFNKVVKNVEKKGENIMKKSNRRRRPAVVAASVAVACLVSGAAMQTSFAKDMVEKVVKTLTSGHITAVQTENKVISDIHVVPDEFKGKLFDKNGKVLEAVTKETKGEMYNDKGELIVGIMDGQLITEKQQAEIYARTRIEIKDKDEIGEHTSFKVILPSYLPDGYKFYKADTFKTSGKYLTVIFRNEKTGKEIYMHQRAAGEDTKYVIGTDGKIENVKINGVDAILADDRKLDWENHDVLYGLSGKGNVSMAELIKIAESMK